MPFARLSFRRRSSVGKVDLIHHFAGRYGLRRYLEFVSVTTGHHFGDLDRGRFDLCKRLMYRCPPHHEDGLPIDYRSPGLDIAGALAALAGDGHRFDIMLVDPYHSYEASLRDIEAAFEMLEPGGVMVVHDCLPPSREMASPTFIPVNWCGETYRAFLNFVCGRTDLRYLTVDTDYGCGVIRKLPWRPARAGRIEARRQRHAATWRRVCSDAEAAWHAFEAHRRSLLRLVGPRAVLSGRRGLD